MSVKGKYAFVDVPEGVADQVIDKLSSQGIAEGGEKLFVKRAITVSITKDGGPEEVPAESESGASSDEGYEAESGPTMLAVDDSL